MRWKAKDRTVYSVAGKEKKREKYNHTHKRVYKRKVTDTQFICDNRNIYGLSEEKEWRQ